MDYRIRHLPEAIDHQFLLDLSAALLEHRSLPESTTADCGHVMDGPSCTYHVHKEGETCADEEHEELSDTENDGGEWTGQTADMIWD